MADSLTINNDSQKSLETEITALYLNYLQRMRSDGNTEGVRAALHYWFSFLKSSSVEWDSVNLNSFGDYVYSFKLLPHFDTLDSHGLSRWEGAMNIHIHTILDFYNYSITEGCIDKKSVLLAIEYLNRKDNL
jgi:hypothetical protein